MNDRSRDKVPATPRARQLARDLNIDLMMVSPRSRRIESADVLTLAATNMPSSTGLMEVFFDATHGRRLIGEMAANTLAGEAPPTLGDLFIKSVAAAVEMHALLQTERRHCVGLYQLAPPHWIVAPDILGMELRDIAAWTADLASAGHAGHGRTPSLLIADSARWGLANLQLDVPPGANSLLTMIASADPLEAETPGTIRVQFRSPQVSAETALRVSETLVDLMTHVDWSLH